MNRTKKQPRLVYVVVCGFDYEGKDIKAVLATRPEAEAVAEKFRDDRYFSFDTVNIEQWELGKIVDRRWESSQ